jgi:hypothetical protein
MNKTRNISIHLPKILYYDSKGYNPKEINSIIYFTEKSDDKKTEKGNINTKHSNEENQRETTRVLNNENDICDGEKNTTLQLKENKDNNTPTQTLKVNENLKVNNFIENCASDKHVEDNNEPKSPEKSKLISYEDYKLLEIYDLFLDKRSFIQCLKDLLIQNHSLISCIFKRSLLEPSFVRFIKLHFELNLQFAFCAVLFSDSFIEHRLNNPIGVINLLTYRTIFNILSHMNYGKQY